MNYFKYEEIASTFADFIEEQTPEWIAQNIDDIHHHAFNMDYYIIGTWKATQWLEDRVFEVINIIKDYEQDNFGEVSTDLSNPERVVNMYTYIVGESVVSEWLEKREVAA